MIDALAYVLAGGDGKRLRPLTENESKPGVSFGPHRVIDFALSNLRNSAVSRILVMAQGPFVTSLEGHLEHVWAPEIKEGEFLTLVTPAGNARWNGTVSPVAQNLEHIAKHSPTVVNVFCADHIYFMDVSQMNASHLSARADLTISAMPVRRELAAGNYGVLSVDKRGQLIAFEEKPADPVPMIGNPDYCLASMGNYAFNPSALRRVLGGDAGELRDFGHDVVPLMLKEGMAVNVYNLQGNKVPGAGVMFWRDIGNIPQFHMASMEAARSIPIDLNNGAWRIRKNGIAYPEPAYGIGAELSSVVVSRGDRFGRHSSVSNSVFSYAVVVGDGAKVSETACLGNNVIGDGAVVKRAILDRGARVPAGVRVGIDAEEDAARGLPTFGGIPVVRGNYKFS